jgi:hypothetical protein
MKRVLSLIALYFLLSSHELFLKTDSFYLNSNQSCELYLFNGTFDESENVITRDRIVNAKVVGPQYAFYPDESDYYDNGKVTYLKIKTGQEGSYVAGISTIPRIIKLSASDFKSYLEHEGLVDVIKKREKDGISHLPARERYSKHVKAILQVSDVLTDHYESSVDYPIEFIPLENPYSLSVGDSISFKLLLQGKSLPDQVVHYSCRSFPGSNLREESSTRTDEKGILRILLDKTGKWYIATIHMTEGQEEQLDYESNWATLTFEIK